MERLRPITPEDCTLRLKRRRRLMAFSFGLRVISTFIIVRDRITQDGEGCKSSVKLA